MVTNVDWRSAWLKFYESTVLKNPKHLQKPDRLKKKNLLTVLKFFKNQLTLIASPHRWRSRTATPLIDGIMNDSMVEICVK